MRLALTRDASEFEAATKTLFESRLEHNIHAAVLRGRARDDALAEATAPHKGDRTPERPPTPKKPPPRRATAPG